MENDPDKRGRQARRVETERRLVEAVGAILRDDGVGALGINAVARRAGADKALIYRYFGGLDGLLRAYGQTAEFWPTLDDILGEDRAVLREPDPARLGAEVMMRYLEALEARPVTVRLLAWECVSSNELTVALEEVREARSTELFTALAEAGVPIGEHVARLSAILAAAMNYLSIRLPKLEVFAGQDMSSPGGRGAMRETLEVTFRALFAAQRAGDDASHPG